MIGPRDNRQRGSALIFVTIIGLVISVAFSLFMTSTVMTEQRAVETSLARTRVYWAEMGNFQYAMSRISYSGLINGSQVGNLKDTDLAQVLQAYFNELSNNRTWTYADESSDYSVTTTDTAAADEDSTRQTYSGWLKATSANKRLNRLGMRNATLKASVKALAPNKEAISNSRTKPVTREAKVNKETTEAD